MTGSSCAILLLWPAFRTYDRRRRHSRACSSLRELLATPRGTRAFMSFCAREFCVESLRFWHTCAALRKRHGAAPVAAADGDDGVQLDVASARAVHDEFVEEDSVQQVK